MPDNITQAQLDMRRTVLTQIDKHPELHSQTSWFGENWCGTTHCIAGWVVELTPDARFVTGYSGTRVGLPGRSPADIARFAADRLGLTTLQADRLFFEYDNPTARNMLAAVVEHGAEILSVQ